MSQPSSSGWSNSSSTPTTPHQHHQHHHPPPDSSSLPPADDQPPYNDPRHLLTIYPFATYQPIARTAEHMAPHTVSYPPQASSSELYPQHASYFNRLDNPSTPEDWALRRHEETRLREMMSSQPSYTGSYLPSPSLTVDPATFLPPSISGPIPMPYNFMSSYLPSPSSTVQQSPIPDRPSSPPSQSEFLDRFVGETLAKADARAANAAKEATERPKPSSSSTAPTSASPSKTLHLSRNGSVAEASGSSLARSSSIPNGHSNTQPQTPSHRSRQRESSITSHNSTPHLSHAMAKAGFVQESPDPLSMTSPSPSKRPRRSSRSSSREISPSVRYNPSPDKSRILEVVIPSRTPKKGSELDMDEDGEYEDEEDDLGWSDNGGGDVDNDGDYKMDGDQLSSPHRDQARRRMISAGSGKTVEKDDRNNAEKLQSLLDEVLNESDSFPSDPTTDDLRSSRYFDRLNHDRSAPLLAEQLMARLVRYLTRVQTGRNRARETPVSQGYDMESLGRVLRLLDRSITEVDVGSVFPTDSGSSTTAHPTSKGKKGGSKSKSPDGDVKMCNGSGETGIPPDELARLEEKLLRMRSAALAANCILTILNVDGFPKHLLSEDVLSVAVSFIRDLLTVVILPIIGGLAGDKSSSRLMSHLIDLEKATGGKKSSSSSETLNNPHLQSIAQSCCNAIPHLTSLISRTDIALDEQLVIRTVYLSIAPLFVSSNDGQQKKKGKGKSKEQERLIIAKSLSVESLACLRATFARYEEQRQWILEEIMSSMVKNGDQSLAQAKYRLSNGQSISTISALLLQLVQASAFGIRQAIRKIKAPPTDIMDLSQSQITPAVATAAHIEEEQRVCTDIIDAAIRSVHTVIGYLIQRSGSAKSSKASHDMDYKAILDTFVADLLSVLYKPEWPAAALYLNVLSRKMFSAFEDGRGGGDSAAKSIALDYLGDVAARLRSLQLQMEESSTPTFDEVISSADVDATTRLLQSQQTVLDYLTVSSQEDNTFKSSLDLESVICAQERYTAITKIRSVLEKLASEKDEDAVKTREQLQQIQELLVSSSDGLWDPAAHSVDISSVPKTAEDAQMAGVGIARGRTLQGAFEPILGALLNAMENPVIGQRSKALRGLGSIVTIDPSILNKLAVKNAIEKRLEDAASSVQDAAVELVGKYVVEKPAVATEYYPVLAARLHDKGVAVRKRVIKLFKDISGIVDSKQIQVDICCQMVVLVPDMDESVKDLAIKTLTELLFSPKGSASTCTTAEMLVDMLEVYEGQLGDLQPAIREVSQLSRDGGHTTRLTDTVKILLDRLIDATEESDFDSLNHIRAIYLLCTAENDLIDAERAQILLTYLQTPADTTDQRSINEVLLKIFGKCIPSMPKSASLFAADLSKLLLPMINKPAGTFTMLRETIACFCALANHLTNDYAPVLRVLRACEAKIRVIRDTFLSKGITQTAYAPTTPIMLYICAFIAEFSDLDIIGDDNDLVRQEVAKITDRPLHEYLYDSFLDFTHMPINQGAPAICLGSLFKAYPPLIQRDESIAWMEKVFASADAEAHARLLSIIYEFLVSQSDAKARAETGTDVTALIGHAESSDSAFSPGVVQRNRQYIHRSAGSQHVATRNAAMNIVALMVNQALDHPLECMRILIPLETSEIDSIAERAFELHRQLHLKRTSWVSVRFYEHTRASFEYQRSLTSEVSGHRDGVALLWMWYSLLREKRAWKNDFLKQLCRAFDYDLSKSSSIDDGCALYVAENLACLDYKIQEEVMVVVQLLSGVISSCAHLVSVLESGSLDGEPHEKLAGKVLRMGKGEVAETFPADAVVQASILVGIAIITKNHLLDLYGLPEDKCIKHQVGKKSSTGDKPAVRRGPVIGLDFGRMSLIRGVQTVQEYEAQRDTFLHLLQEDGTLDDPDRL